MVFCNVTASVLGVGRDVASGIDIYIAIVSDPVTVTVTITVSVTAYVYCYGYCYCYCYFY